MRYLFIFIAVALAYQSPFSQNIWDFTSIPATGQTDSLTLPTTHRFQVLAVSLQELPNGEMLAPVPDFAGYVPINGSSNNGYLSLNHEISTPDGTITVFDMHFNAASRLWDLTNPEEIDFTSVQYLDRPCSGLITPWGNVIVGEEPTITTVDINGDGYHDSGWLVEINPSTRQVVQKLYKAGKMRHENAALAADNRTIYFASEESDGFVYRFIGNSAGNLATGDLFVLKLEDEEAANGEWVSVPNSTPDQCNSVQAYGASMGATDFGALEDVEIGKDGRIYFSCKGNGRVRVFRDNGATVSEAGVFVMPATYEVQTPDGMQEIEWGNGADNLAFDNDGNLWVCHDSNGDFSTDLNYVWVVAPSHTTANPNLKVFLSSPKGSEPTGLTFSPDNRFIFMSFQFASSTSNTYTAHDVAGTPIIFKRGVTVAIARKEKLGPEAGPVSTFDAMPAFLSMHVSPTSVRSGDRVLLSLSDGTLDSDILMLFDLNGHVVYQQKMNLPRSNNQYAFVAPELASGQYFICIKGRSGALHTGQMIMIE